MAESPVEDRKRSIALAEGGNRAVSLTFAPATSEPSESLAAHFARDRRYVTPKLSGDRAQTHTLPVLDYHHRSFFCSQMPILFVHRNTLTDPGCCTWRLRLSSLPLSRCSRCQPAALREDTKQTIRSAALPDSTQHAFEVAALSDSTKHQSHHALALRSVTRHYRQANPQRCAMKPDRP